MTKIPDTETITKQYTYEEIKENMIYTLGMLKKDVPSAENDVMVMIDSYLHPLLATAKGVGNSGVDRHIHMMFGSSQDSDAVHMKVFFIDKEGMERIIWWTYTVVNSEEGSDGVPADITDFLEHFPSAIHEEDICFGIYQQINHLYENGDPVMLTRPKDGGVGDKQCFILTMKDSKFDIVLSKTNYVMFQEIVSSFSNVH